MNLFTIIPTNNKDTILINIKVLIDIFTPVFIILIIIIIIDFIIKKDKKY